MTDPKRARPTPPGSARACRSSARRGSRRTRRRAPPPPRRYWRINGTGRGFAGVERVVDDGNVGAYVFKDGPWAGPELDGRLQLYYNPIQREEKGAKIAEVVSAPVRFDRRRAALPQRVGLRPAPGMPDAPPGTTPNRPA